MTSTFSQRTVERLAGKIQPNRRGLLGATTVVGAAVATAPWKFLTRPASAYDAVCGSHNTCVEGYTVFCCTVNGGKNSCPPGAWVGGWWKADNSNFCGGAARYYIDCHEFASARTWPCSCNNDPRTCDHRRVSCNQFRYGQCNTHVPMSNTGPVLCRVVSCTPPWQQYGGQCTTTSRTDNNTANHNAPCLVSDHHQGTAVTTLLPGQQVASPNGRYVLIMQGDGNLVIYGPNGAVWSSGTALAGSRMIMQSDGNLVVYGPQDQVVWATMTQSAGARLILNNFGNLVIVSAANTTVWTRTATSYLMSTPVSLPMASGDRVTAYNGRYRLVMQGDGNLVVYDRNVAKWHAGSFVPGSRLVLQSDGNLVITGPDGQAIWWTGTTDPGARLWVQADGNVVMTGSAGQLLWALGRRVYWADRPVTALASGEAVMSVNRAYRLAMQGDGNLVLYMGGVALWATNTYVAGTRMVVQADGNLVLYTPAGAAVWNSGTSGRPGVQLLVRGDGEMILHSAAQGTVWSSGTRR